MSPPDPVPSRPPSVISVEVDACYTSILVDRSPGLTGVVELDPAQLPLTPALCARLAEWHERYDTLSRRWINDEPETPRSREDDARLDHDMLTLAYDVRNELGPDVEALLSGGPLNERHGR
jgi:hypothetical protein